MFAVDYDDLTSQEHRGAVRQQPEFFASDLAASSERARVDHDRAAASLIYCCSRKGLKDPAKYGLVVVPARERGIAYSYRFYGEDGSHIDLPPGPLPQGWRQYPVMKPLRRRR